MSRYYSMYVTVSNVAPEKRDRVKEAANGEWGFGNWRFPGSELTACAEGQLCGGETEAEFSQRLAKAIWEANGGYCKVEVNATYLEELPYETYCLDEGDYQRLVAACEGSPST